MYLIDKFNQNYYKFLVLFLGLSIINYFYGYDILPIVKTTIIILLTGLSLFLTIYSLIIFNQKRTFQQILENDWFVFTKNIILIILIFSVGLYACHIRISSRSYDTLKYPIKDKWVAGKVNKASANKKYGNKYIIDIIYIADTKPNSTDVLKKNPNNVPYYYCNYREHRNNPKLYPCPKKIRLKVFSKQEINLGEIILTKLNIYNPSYSTTPRGYDFSFRAFFSNINGVSHSKNNIEIISKESPNQLPYVRSVIKNKILKILDDDDASIAIALMLGDKNHINNINTNNIRNSGLAHLFAISGLHLILVSGIIFLVIRKLLSYNQILTLNYNIKKIAASLTIFLTFLYLAIVDFPISAQRAYIILFLILFGVIIDRVANPLASISIGAFIILLLKSEVLFSPSFQLSFAAATALIFMYHYINNKLNKNYNKGMMSYHERFIMYNTMIITSSLIATIATLPIIIYHFHTINIYGALSNIIAIPIVSFVIMPLLILTMSLMFTPIYFIPLILVKYPIKILLLTAKFFGNLKYATISILGINNIGLLISGLILYLIFSINNKKLLLLIIIFLTLILFSFGLNKKPDIIIDSNAKSILLLDKNKTLFLTNSYLSPYKRLLYSKENGQKYIKYKSLRKQDIFQCIGYSCVLHKNNHSILLYTDYKNKKPKSTINQRFCGKYDLIINLASKQLECKQKKFNIESDINLTKNDIFRNKTHYLYLNSDKIKIEHPLKYRFKFLP